MKLELLQWDEHNLAEIAHVFTCADRRYLADGLPMPYTVEDVRRWLNDVVAKKEGRDGLFRTLCFDGRCVGDVALERKENVYARDADIGYVLLDEYRGQELMTEAVGRICAEAFDALDLLRVTARVCAPNLASRRVLEKNGFALEGAMRRAVCKGGEIYDLCIYGRLR